MSKLQRIFVIVLAAAAVVIVAQTGMVSAQTNEPLPTPQNFTVVNGPNPGEAIASWEAVADATYYRVGWVAVDDALRAFAEETDIYDHYVFADISSATSFTVTGLQPGKTYYFTVESLRERFGKSASPDIFQLQLNNDTSPCPSQVSDRADLHEPIQPPMAPAYMDWRWESDQAPFRELITDFTIHNDVGDWSDQHGYYLILTQNYISDTGFYFGLQTNANGLGKAVIFSRWETADLSNAKWADRGGWYELGQHEGGFIGVRRTYNWGQGNYRVRIAPDGLESDGEWFSVWITDLDTNITTWVGSLKFPLVNGTATIRPYSSATIELYGNPPIPPIDTPQWHVSIKRPSGDSVPSTYGFTNYPFDDSENALPNSDVRYESSEGVAHLVVGGTTERNNPAVGRIDFEEAPASQSSDTSEPSVVTRDLEYSYAISISDDWTAEGEGRYSRSSPWSQIRVTSLELASGVTLEEYTAHVQNSLAMEWWPSLSLFEITSLQKKRSAGQDFYAIRYRVQESPEYCVLDVSELITVSNALPGSQRGFRVRMWMCEQLVSDHDQDRTQILESFRVAITPATYYTQFLSVEGVVIKATGKVDPQAFYVAADIIGPMLSGRQDIADCMATAGGALAIIPKDEYVTTVPEFAHLKGSSDRTGRAYESFKIRGLGGVKSQPVSSTSEETLLRLDPVEYPHNRFSFDSLITVHEYAHGIQNLCFTQDDHERWNGFYAAAKEANIFPGAHMMTNEEEFFAVFSTAYFEVTDEIGRGADRSTVKETYPDIYEFLEEIYQGAVLPPELRSRRSR